MIIYLLGLLDLLTAISLILLRFKVDFFALFFALYLIIKSVLFIKSLASVFDLISGIVFILALYGYFGIITYIASIWLIQKAIFSFLSSF
ncbi:hypothetical protein J4409_01650 [Candidatus Woesearchaeota archaeon]|nr:hypothetical protein [Candidatus Woesearchaeota archaeon]